MLNLLSEPTVRFCEIPREGIIKRPFYAFSNLAFLIVGIIILKEKNKLSKLFGWTSIMIALFSGLYDTFYIYGLQLLDISGMFLFINLLIYLNLNMLTRFHKNTIIAFQLLAYILSMIFIINFRSHSGNIVFGTYLLLFVFTELIIYSKQTRNQYKYWFMAMFLFIIAFALWIPDAKRAICFDFGLLNGRAIFHYLTAVSIFYLYRFYSQNTLD